MYHHGWDEPLHGVVYAVQARPQEARHKVCIVHKVVEVQPAASRGLALRQLLQDTELMVEAGLVCGIQDHGRPEGDRTPSCRFKVLIKASAERSPFPGRDCTSSWNWSVGYFFVFELQAARLIAAEKQL